MALNELKVKNKYGGNVNVKSMPTKLVNNKLSNALNAQKRAFTKASASINQIKIAKANAVNIKPLVSASTFLLDKNKQQKVNAKDESANDEKVNSDDEWEDIEDDYFDEGNHGNTCN